jgi:outer membrane immunogenic protein
MNRRSLAFIAAVSTVALTQIASAADLPRKAPAYTPPPPIAYTWTGFYIGAHAGYRWVDADLTFPSVLPGDPFNPELNYSLDSFVGGAQVGYNFQVTPNWVVGVEGDWSWGNRSKTQQFDFVDLDQPVTVKAEWNASLRGRLGYAWDRSLFYVTGGVAWMRVKVEALDFDAGVLDPTGSATETRTFTGWTAGLGYEQAFLSNWTARIEYLYADYGNERFFEGLTTSTFFPADVDLKTHTVRAGLNYKF